MVACHHLSRHFAPPGSNHGSLRLLHRSVFRRLVQSGAPRADAFSVLFSHVDLLHTPVWLLHAGNGSGTTGAGRPATRFEPRGSMECCSSEMTPRMGTSS